MFSWGQGYECIYVVANDVNPSSCGHLWNDMRVYMAAANKKEPGSYELQ